ncbi:MAG: hypothetical protein MK297_02215 [Planctomycetes bacterium]|nr:hypothetical protein [Planctomycetota bacterium]
MRLAGVIALALSACGAPGASPEVGVSRLDESLEPVFRELKAALDEGSDDVARAILSRLKPRCQDELSLRIAEGYERVLGGRAARDDLSAAVLVSEVPGGFEPRLSLLNRGSTAMVLTPGYVRVEWTAWSVDSAGRQSAQVGGDVVSFEEGWSLTPGKPHEVPLGFDSPRVGDSALAVRVEWRASLGAGSATLSGEALPLQGLNVQDGVIVRLSKELPTAPVDPLELLRYACGGEVSLPALLERAVRIHPSRYEEALDLFALRRSSFSPKALLGLAPVLAWLTGTTGISASGEDWATWLADRAQMKTQGDELDLPDGVGR